MDKKSYLYVFIVFSIFFLINIVYSFQGGDGSSGDPYQISTCTELQNMSNCLSCNYTLISNVDCNGFDSGDGFGFLPVNNFVGSLDGQNFKISNLFINRSGSTYVGLFGYIDSSTVEISNVGLENVEIYGSTETGGLVGHFSDGIMNNSYTTGIVNSNGDRIGGLIGYNVGASVYNSFSSVDVSGSAQVGGFIGYRNGGEIDNCYASGNVNGNSLYIGGFVGLNQYGDVTNCYATGNVQGNNKVGGFIGTNNWGVSNSYSTGNVNGSDNVGGLIGENTEGNVQNSFTISSVTGLTNVGGLSGLYSSGSFTNTFWNNNTNNPSNAIGSGSVAGYTTIQNNLSYFYDCSNEPIATWSTLIWGCSGSDVPHLLWQLVGSSQSTGASSVFPFQSTIVLTLMVMGFYFIFS